MPGGVHLLLGLLLIHLYRLLSLLWRTILRSENGRNADNAFLSPSRYFFTAGLLFGSIAPDSDLPISISLFLIRLLVMWCVTCIHTHTEYHSCVTHS